MADRIGSEPRLSEPERVPDDIYGDEYAETLTIVGDSITRNQARKVAAQEFDMPYIDTTARRVYVRPATAEECALHGWDPPAAIGCPRDHPAARAAWEVEG